MSSTQILYSFLILDYHELTVAPSTSLYILIRSYPKKLTSIITQEKGNVEGMNQFRIDNEV